MDTIRLGICRWNVCKWTALFTRRLAFRLNCSWWPSRRQLIQFGRCRHNTAWSVGQFLVKYTQRRWKWHLDADVWILVTINILLHREEVVVEQHAHGLALLATFPWLVWDAQRFWSDVQLTVCCSSRCSRRLEAGELFRFCQGRANLCGCTRSSVGWYCPFLHLSRRYLCWRYFWLLTRRKRRCRRCISRSMQWRLIL